MWLSSFGYEGSLKSLKPHWALFDKCVLANDNESKPATGPELKCSWRDKDLFNKLMLLIHTACFGRGVFSERLLIISE